MLFTDFGISTEASETLLQKAPSPMLVTVCGMVTALNDMSENAFCPMLVTFAPSIFSGITTWSSTPLYSWISIVLSANTTYL